MSFYIQYHNCEVEGLPLSFPPFQQTRLGIHTRRPSVRNANGQVFLIAGIGQPRRYYLWETFEIKDVKEVRHEERGQEFHASGEGWQLCPPQRLDGKQFADFKSKCANFIGFRCIDDLAYCSELRKLADQHRPPGKASEIAAFLQELRGLVLDESETELIEKCLKGVAGRDGPTPAAMRALSIRQPHAEAIMRGIKPIEFRSAPTRIRGRIHIYASLGRYSAADEAEMMDEYGIEDVACDDLPRGVLIGTVELHDCNGGNWHVRSPERATKLLKPKKQPQPVWFNPF